MIAQGSGSEDLSEDAARVVAVIRAAGGKLACTGLRVRAALRARKRYRAREHAYRDGRDPFRFRTAEIQSIGPSASVGTSPNTPGTDRGASILSWGWAGASPLASRHVTYNACTRLRSSLLNALLEDQPRAGMDRVPTRVPCGVYRAVPQIHRNHENNAPRNV